MKRTISMALSLILLLGITLTANAATPRYAHIAVLNAGLGIDAKGLSSSTAAADCQNSSVNVTVTANLQQYKNSTWTTIKTWTKTENGSFPVLAGGDYYVTSGSKYRVQTVAQVKNLSGTVLETQSMYSAEKTY